MSLKPSDWIPLSLCTICDMRSFWDCSGNGPWPLLQLKSRFSWIQRRSWPVLRALKRCDAWGKNATRETLIHTLAMNPEASAKPSRALDTS